jgi:hypothetical protein
MLLSPPLEQPFRKAFHRYIIAPDVHIPFVRFVLAGEGQRLRQP